MSKPYTPLFNRTYLTILAWFSAITILVLATQTGPSALPSLERQGQAPVYWTEYADSGHGLSVLIPTQSGILDSDRTQQYLLKSLLDAQLTTTAFTASTSYTTKVYSDYVELQINWQSAESRPDIEALWQVLSTPIPSALLTHLQTQARAKSYIEANKLKTDLTQQFLNNIYRTQAAYSTQPHPTYADQLAAASVVVYGDDAQDIADDIAVHWALKMQPLTLRPSTAPTTDLTQQNATGFTLVKGQALSARTEPNYLLDRIAVGAAQNALEAHSANTGLSYALKYAGLHDSGYIVFELKSDYPVASQLNAISQQVTEEGAEAAKAQIISRWYALAENPAAIRDALNRSALYQLPDDEFSRFNSLVEDIEVEDIIKKATALFIRQAQLSHAQPKPSLHTEKADHAS